MSAVCLLVFDNGDRCLSDTRIMMEKLGIATETVARGPDALHILAQRPVDVVVVDVETAEMETLALLQQIKQLHPLVEVILLSGDASAGPAVAGLKTGAFDYLLKPCDASLIAQKAQEAFDQKRCNEDRLRRERIDRIMRHPMAVFEKNHKG